MTPRKWLILICLLWYTTSSLNNVVGKSILLRFPSPLTLTFIQLASISLYSIPLLRYLNRPHTNVPRDVYNKFIIPLAVGKFLASVASHWSIWVVPLSYVHTVKATTPLFTVVITRLLYKTTHSKQIYLSLIPIVLGVIIATLNEINFNIIGLTTALTSTLFFTLQNIFSKQVLRMTTLHQFELLSTLARLSLLIFTPIYLLTDFKIVDADYEMVLLLLLDGLLCFLQNLLAFSFLKLASPLTYSVANASKRLFVIVFSVFVFGNYVGWFNVMGMGMAVGGVVYYSVVKDKKLKYNLNNNVV